MTAQERITEWAALAENATDGPGWFEVVRTGLTWVVYVFEDGSLYDPEGSAVGRAELAVLVAEGKAHRMIRADGGPVPAMAAALTAVLELHRPCDNDAERTPICENCHGKAGVHSCGCWADHDSVPVCATCNEGFKSIRVEWPCPTVAAIETALGVTP